jgi:cell division initiation protein
VDQREALVKSLKRISQDMLNQIDLSDAHFSRIDAKAYQRAIDELSRSNAFTFANIENLAPEEEVIPEPEKEDPMAEMEVIEEELELEIHDSTPDLKIEVEETQEEIELETKAVEEKEEPKEEPEPIKEEKKTIIKDSIPKEEKPKLKEDTSNQSGSFFDQFD